MKPTNIVGLQRYIGNQGVQRLIAQRTLTPQSMMQMKPEIQRCSCGGTCAACKGKEEDIVH